MLVMRCRFGKGHIAIWEKKESTFFKIATYSPRELKLVACPDSLLFFELVSKPNS